MAAAARARAKARIWEEQGLTCLSGPYVGHAQEFERLADVEAVCSCGKFPERRPGLAKLLDL